MKIILIQKQTFRTDDPCELKRFKSKVWQYNCYSKVEWLAIVNPKRMLYDLKIPQKLKIFVDVQNYWGDSMIS